VPKFIGAQLWYHVKRRLHVSRLIAGHLLAVASNDGTVKMIEIGTSDVTILAGHDDAVQAVDFDLSGQFMVSGGSDGCLRIWA